MINTALLRKILNSSGMGIKKYAGRTAVTDSVRFRGASSSALEEAQSLVEDSVREDTYALSRKAGTPVMRMRDVEERADKVFSAVVDSLQKGRKSAPDAYRTAVRDSMINPSWNVGMPSDPAVHGFARPNIYLSPWEAQSLYSQKGLFETIINKKAKSILLNGLNIKNALLSQKQLDEVKARAEMHSFSNVIADGTRDSLVYGGSLVFPMFRRDTPVTVGMKLDALMKTGVLGKHCIDYFVTLDRWNTFIVPPYNPTQKDFLHPDVYTVPFLGADVYHARCARIVTAEQAGYWGQVINQGWGISDFCGYLQSGTNYKVAVQSLPLMIQQMSILVRAMNVDGVLATEGSNALDALVEADTVRMREVSAENPITMDVLGDIKSINRDFAQVPELIRLLRQDVSSDATIPEPMLFSSEKGNFSSGDDTQGNQSKQWEAVKMIHKEVEAQCRQLAKIMIIDALGTDREVVEALPYTQIHFDEPVIANAVERSQIGKNLSENVFNLVSARIPIDTAVEMAYENTSMDMKVSAEIVERLKAIQKRADDADEERVRLEMEQMKAEVKATEEGTAVQKALVQGKKEEADPAEKQAEIAERKASGENRRPDERLEQKSSEKARIGQTKRSEKLAKRQNKVV